MTKIPLDTPIIAYLVDINSIVPFEVTHRFTERTHYTSFSRTKAVWTRDYTLQWSSKWCYIIARPSDKGYPFEHPSVAYSIDDAIILLKNKSLKQAEYYKKEAQRCIERAARLETTNYRDLVLGDKQSYTSIFTGEKQ